MQVNPHTSSGCLSGSDAFFGIVPHARRPERPTRGVPHRPQRCWDHERRPEAGDLRRVSRTPIPTEGYKGITAFIVERDLQGPSRSARRRTKLGILASSTNRAESLDGVEVPSANVLGPVRSRGTRVANSRPLNEGRIGIGAQIDRQSCQGALGAAHGVREGAAKQFRQAARRVSRASSFPASRRPRTEAEARAADGVQRAPTQGRRPRHLHGKAAMSKLFSSQGPAERVHCRFSPRAVFGGYGVHHGTTPPRSSIATAKIGRDLRRHEQHASLQTICEGKMLK